jgi:hypothetical protein
MYADIKKDFKSFPPDPWRSDFSASSAFHAFSFPAWDEDDEKNNDPWYY